MPSEDQNLRKRLAALSPADRLSVLEKLKGRKQSGTLRSEDHGIQKAKPERIEPGSGAKLYKAAPAQERMYFLHEFSGRSTTYSSNCSFHLKGNLNVEQLESAFEELITRHDSLRTSFVMLRDTLWQRVMPQVQFSLRLLQAEGSSPTTRRQSAKNIINELAAAPFDLGQDSLIHVTLVEIDKESFILLISSHHIITDGWSFNILFKELSTLYNARITETSAQLPALKIQLADYSKWQIDKLSSEEWKEHFDYWVQNLKDEPDPLELPWDFERNPQTVSEGGSLTQALDPELYDRLSELASSNRSTLFMVLLAAFKMLLLKYSNETDLVVGVPIANRLIKETEQIFGCLINTLAMRTNCSGNPTFHELLDRVKTTSLNAFPHQEVPFDRVIKQLKIRRFPGRAPLFQTHFTLQNFPPSSIELIGLKVSRYRLKSEKSKFDFAVAVERSPDGWHTKFSFSKGLFKPETVQGMARAWNDILTRICDSPQDSIHDIIGAQSIPEAPPTSPPPPEALSLHARFEQQVENTPYAPALQDDRRSLSFRELNERSNKLAHYLIKKGVGPETIVGLHVPISVEMIVGILGILKAGGAYLPLDPGSPGMRNFKIIEDSRISLVLNVSTAQLQIPDYKGDVIDINDPEVERESACYNPLQPVGADNLAYIIYTSGSSGSPKGVMVEHRNILSYISGLLKTIPFEDGNYAMTQPLTADASQTMLLIPLLNGGCLHLVSRDCSLNPQALSQYLQKHSIDYFKITPAHLAVLLELFPTSKLFPKKILLIGGEALPVDLVRTICKLTPPCRIWNHYGPTETTVGVLAQEVSLYIQDHLGKEGSIPIGKPFNGVIVHILDDAGKPVSKGDIGEIHIGGKTVTRGYLNNPEQTSRAFIPNPIDPEISERLYRTGDTATMLQDGSVQFIGRKDDQVKISGYRIEPGDVESALAEHPSILNKVVLAGKDDSGLPCLIAFVVPRAGEALEGIAIRKFLASRLPEPMIPGKVQILDKLPLTGMGKVDRMALLKDFQGKSPSSRGQVMPNLDSKVAAESRAKKVILSICRDLLGLQEIFGHQSFFELGGNSLVAMRLSARVNESLGTDFPLRLLFESSCLDEVIDVVSKRLQEQDPHPSVLQPESGCAHYLFEKQSLLNPDAMALEMFGHSITYGELNTQSNKLAHHLREIGVVPDSLVGIHLDRSMEMIVAVLAILKAGGGCLPLDLSHPEIRIATILEDAKPGWILCSATSKVRIPGSNSRVITLDYHALSQGTDSDPEHLNNPEDLAYVLYTSGSTGQPKGVQVPHRTLDNLIRWQLGESNCDRSDGTLQFASLTFDVSFQEILSTLGQGGCLVLVDDELRRDVSRLAAHIAEKNISRLFLPYIALDALATEFIQADLDVPRLKEVVTAGEQLKVTSSIRKFFLRHPEAVLINQYGPTESHVVTCYTLQGNPLDWPTLPSIGKPITNANIYLLDGDLKPVADGDIGEIFIGGTPLARGYLNKDDLTRSRFVDLPIEPDERVYRTGDLARRREDGSYQFIGRNDQQIKFRGFRIELGEIETVLMQYKGIRECVVMARKYGDDNKQLVAFVIPEFPLESSSIRDYLLERLPEYMVPAAIEFLEAFPLNPNGKVDRKALVSRESISSPVSIPVQPSGSSTRDVISEIWFDTLNNKSIQPDDNFFKIGGHSLLATRIVSRIKKYLSVDCSIRLLFENPTIKSLSEAVENLKAPEGRPDELGNATIAIEPSSNACPASYAQQRLWFIDQFEGGSSQYLIPMCFLLKGSLDSKAIESALREIIKRHGTLRTHFSDQDGVLYQVINDVVPFKLSVEDPPPNRNLSLEEVADTILLDEKQQDFDLSRAPLFRARMVRVSSTEHVLLLIFHHVISDGWSGGVFIKELKLLYNDLSKGKLPGLEPLSHAYTDYSEWQQKWLQGDRLNQQKKFWESYLEGSGILELPTDYQRPEMMTYRGGRVRFQLSRDLSDRLRKFNLAARTTPFMSLMATFQILLSRYSGQTDLTIGTPIANRRKVEFEKLIGFFANTLVIRTDLSANPGFQEVVERVKESALNAFAHQDFPFEKMVETINPERHINRHPLFQVLFALQNAPRKKLEFDNLSVTPYSPPGLTTHFDLELHLSQSEDEWRGTISYSSDLFKRATIQSMADEFPHLLENLLSSPSLPIKQIVIDGPADRETLLHKWNPPTRNWPDSKAIHELFEIQAAKSPFSTALRFDEKSLSYKEVNEQANRIAHFLMRESIPEDSLVAIFAERSFDLVTGILAILKSGNAYLPLDMASPQDRLRLILEDAKAPVILTAKGLLEKLPKTRAKVVLLEDALSVQGLPMDNPSTSRSPEKLAYTIYTSGSTGKPKGVQVSHRNVSRLLSATQGWFNFDDSDVWTLFHSHAFDFSVWEMWGALCNGGRLVIVPYLTTRSPREFHKLLVKEKVTVLNQTPSAFQQLIPIDEASLDSSSLSLRWIIFGGESLSLSSLKSWLERHDDRHPKLANMYGITETTVHATYREIRREDLSKGSVIGQPLPDLQIYILTPGMTPAAIGESGEIYIGGGGVSLGYLNRPDLNAERFIPNPFSEVEGSILYRSGDLARRLQDGDIEFLGRIDNQVQLRGFRIELGEIESVLMDHPDVQSARVILREDVPGDKRLTGYVVPRSSEPLTPGSLRKFAEGKLPNYMVPSMIFLINSMPLTENGKLDINSLPTPDPQPVAGVANREKPQSDLEIELCGIFQEILNIGRIGLHDDFFELGGHSLLAAQVVARAETLFKHDIPLRVFFEHPTVSGLIKSAGEASLQESKRVPLSYVQQRIWFLEDFNAGGYQFNMPHFFALHGNVDLATLEQAINTIISRHEPLRTSFQEIDHQGYQQVEPELEITIPLEVLDIPNGGSLEASVREAAAPFFLEAFDLSKAPLFRAKVFSSGKEEAVLVIVFHHLVSDAWSIDIFLAELSQLYESIQTGLPNPLPPVEFHHSDWINSQLALTENREQVRKLQEFWTDSLSGSPITSTFPPDYPRELVSGVNSGNLQVKLSDDLYCSLNSFARKHNITIFALLLAAFKLVLSRHSGQQDLIIGTPTTGRYTKELESLIGCFLGTIPIRSNVNPESTFLEYLKSLFGNVLTGFDNQQFPFEKMVEVLKPDRSQVHSPIFQILFNYFNSDFKKYSFGDVEMESLDGPLSVAKYDLTVYIRNAGETLNLNFVFNSGLYRSETISQLVKQYLSLIQQVIEDPKRKVWDYSLVTKDEQNLIADPALEIEAPNFEPVTGVISGLAEKHPARVAISQDNEEWSYESLEFFSRTIASSILSKGLKSGDVVALAGCRSFPFIAGLLGILKAGGVFMIVDTNLPAARQATMLAEGNAKWILEISGNGSLVESAQVNFPASGILNIVSDESPMDLKTWPPESLVPPSPQSNAYIFFTSGTTGKPKGIIGNHKGLSHFIDWERKHLGITESDRVANLSGFSFDVLLRDIFLPLSSGACLCLPGKDLKPNDCETVHWISRNNITIIHSVPSIVQSWLDSLDTGFDLSPLRWALIAGEPLDASLIKGWHEHFGTSCRILNLYGTTETTMAKCYHEIPDTVPPGIQPVGIPMPQTQMLVLGPGNRQCGLGEPGEIVIRTPFRASALTGNDSLQDGFRPNPFRKDPSDIVYYTGDIGHVNHSGDLVVTGRIDDQVKIQGVRIEPGEVTEILKNHPEVQGAVVIPISKGNGEKLLVAYYTRNNSSDELPATRIRTYLKSYFPEYMIPAAYIQMSSLPLSANGKLDRNALPPPNFDRDLAFSEFMPPRNVVEAHLAQIWSEVLGIQKVGIRDDFFDIGGHSLLATRVVSHVRANLFEKFPLRSLFDCRTIESLAIKIRQLQTNGKPDHDEGPVKKEIFTAPASSAQQRMWFLERLLPGKSPYLVGGTLHLTGELNYPALQASIDAIVQRHESFRTCFISKQGEPHQKISSSLDVPIAFQDLSTTGKSPNKDTIEKHIRDLRNQPFELEKLPLVSISLIRINSTDHYLSWHCHHVISDGWSVSIFNRELRDFYRGYLLNAPYNPPLLEFQYSDYAKRQRNLLDTGQLNDHVEYWKSKLNNPPILDLPGSHQRPARQSFNGARANFNIPPDLSLKLDEFNSENNSTPFMTLMGTFQLLLARYSGQEDILTGTPIANRTELSFEDVIGCFVNTIAFRTDLSENPSFKDLISRVRNEALDAFEHQDVPFEHLVKELNPVRDPTRHPLFQVIFALQNASGEPLTLENLEVDPYSLKSTKTRFDLELHISADEKGYAGTFNYSTDLFNEEFIESMISRFIHLLDHSLRNPDSPISDWCLLIPSERQRVLIDWNKTNRECQLDLPIHDQFLRQAELSPDSIALEQDGVRLSYKTLENRSNQLAHYLVKQHVQSGDRVGIYLNRSIDLVISFLAILKTGAAYVPLSKDYPLSRLKFMVQDASLKCILGDGSFPEMDIGKECPIHDLPALSLSISTQPDTVPESTVSGDDAAYIIYTSGSTGQPKGTVVPHRGVVRLVRGQDYANFDSKQTFLLLASPSFDASTFEIWAPLLNGARCAIYSPNILDVHKIEKVIAHNKVTTLWLTAGLFNLVVDTSPNLLHQVKHVLTGGEILSPAHVKKAIEINPQLRLTNAYGPTESTTFACTQDIRSEDLMESSIPIGRPISNTQAYILDRYLQPVPPGIPGELVLGGAGLAIGYLDDPELTEAKFVKNTLAGTPGNRLYRTGDICRYLPDGRIEFIGRNDHQVKIRGFRVELGEVESAFLKHPDIERVVIVPDKDSTGSIRLVGYFVTRDGKDGIEPGEMRNFLGEHLPSYAIPAFLCQLKEVPLNPNGKVDLKALPDPLSNPGITLDNTGDCSTSPMEKELIEVWGKLFQKDSITPTDNFFDLGGHSLMAAKMLSEIEHLSGNPLPVAVLFESPTIRELAVRFEKEKTIQISSCLVPLQPKGEKNPLFCIHGWGGDVYGFLDLARTLAPNRPVYGLQAIGLDGVQPKHSTVEEMARYYAKEMIQHHEADCYNLIGYSAGGWIAYAVAKEFHRNGKKVNLAMLDTGMSSRIPYWIYFISRMVHLLNRMPHHFSRWLKLPTRKKFTYVLERFRWLVVSVTRNTDKLPSSTTTEGTIKNYENDYFISVASKYRPTPYDGDLILFSAKGKPWYSHFFWKFLIRGKVDIHFVDGGHHGIIDRYHVGNFSILFQEVLEKLDQSSKDNRP